MKPDDLHAVIGPDFHRLFAGIQPPEAPMPYAKSPDFGHPMQDADEPKPFDEPKFTPQEQDQIALVKCELERQRRAANKRDEDKEIAKLGVVWIDGGDAA